MNLRNTNPDSYRDECTNGKIYECTILRNKNFTNVRMGRFTMYDFRFTNVRIYEMWILRMCEIRIVRSVDESRLLVPEPVEGTVYGSPCDLHAFFVAFVLKLQFP